MIQKEFDIYFENLKPVPDFLPMSLAELNALGHERPDFVLVTGDSYVDHPSFGAAIIGKLLWAQGYTVGIIAQPRWKDPSDFKTFGEPRLAFLVTSGNVDSMVNHYTVAKRRRNEDFYSEDAKAGLRPDRALIVYSRKIRDIFGRVPIIIGGIEASLRRFSHYDYWDNSVRKSVLMDSTADLLVYGMGERQISEIAAYLNSGVSVLDIKYVAGTACRSDDTASHKDTVLLPSYENVVSDKKAYAASFKMQYENTDSITAKTLVEKCGNEYIIQNPPAKPLSMEEMDTIYSIRFSRNPHAKYTKPVPSIQEVKFSINSNRGCFGECNFCALTFHQGATVSARSVDSIISEGEILAGLPDFKGYIHDVGGPTANFFSSSCEKQEKYGMCVNKKCLVPEVCKNLQIDHSRYLKALRGLRAIKGIKKVFIRSGIRYDYLLYDKNPEFLRELCEHHVSGQLKVAPEHVSDNVLALMGKPPSDIYDKFVNKYESMNQKLGKDQFIVPYLMSSHPGSGLSEAVELAEYLRDCGINPQQVQDFYPTPGTVSTCMYYTGTNPLTGEKVFVADNPHDKAMQRALIQYRLPQNRLLVKEALLKAGREDLIGYDKKCLLRPDGYNPHRAKTSSASKNQVEPEKRGFQHKKKTIRNVHKKKVQG